MAVQNLNLTSTMANGSGGEHKWFPKGTSVSELRKSCMGRATRVACGPGLARRRGDGIRMPGLAGRRKRPRSLGPPPFPALTSARRAKAVRLTPSPDFRVPCRWDSHTTRLFRLSLQKEDRFGCLFMFPSIVRAGRWVVGSLKFRPKASSVFGNHSAFLVSGAHCEHLS